MKIKEAIDKFTDQGAPQQYGYVAKQYLRYAVEHGLPVSDESAERYFTHYGRNRQLSSNITSPIRKFLAFAQQQGISHLQPELQLTESLSGLLDRYLESALAPSRPATRAAYTRHLKKYLIYLSEQEKLVSYPTASEYLQHLQASKSIATCRAFLTAIKSLAHWVVLHPQQTPPGSVSTPVEALGQVAYLKTV